MVEQLELELEICEEELDLDFNALTASLNASGVQVVGQAPCRYATVLVEVHFEFHTPAPGQVRCVVLDLQREGASLLALGSWNAWGFSDVVALPWLNAWGQLFDLQREEIRARVQDHYLSC